MAAAVPCRGNRPRLQYRQRLLDLKRSGMPIGVQPPIIVQPVGYIGILLDLRHENARADGVYRSRRDKKTVPRAHRHPLEQFNKGIIP